MMITLKDLKMINPLGSIPIEQIERAAQLTLERYSKEDKPDEGRDAIRAFIKYWFDLGGNNGDNIRKNKI